MTSYRNVFVHFIAVLYCIDNPIPLLRKKKEKKELLPFKSLPHSHDFHRP